MEFVLWILFWAFLYWFSGVYAFPMGTLGTSGSSSLGMHTEFALWILSWALLV